MARKNTEIVTLSLRIREELRKRVEREAKRADRSMNAEIAHRLEQSFEHQDIITAIKETIASHGSAIVIDPDKSEGEDKS
jgi:hypothetical protein